jgi:hypothetical protein
MAETYMAGIDADWRSMSILLANQAPWAGAFAALLVLYIAFSPSESYTL